MKKITGITKEQLKQLNPGEMLVIGKWNELTKTQVNYLKKLPRKRYKKPSDPNLRKAMASKQDKILWNS